MKLVIPSVILLSIYITFLKPGTSAIISREEALANVNASKQKFSIGCAAPNVGFELGDPANVIPLLEGWGDYRMPVTAKNDSAHIYFEQGINMYYGFHIIEALASFEKAVKFDTTFAMGYWGKALAYGPNINDLGYAASPEALAAVNNAKANNETATPVENALIDAMFVRYTADTTQCRDHLNQLYADAMKKVHEAFPESADAAALYADALMVQHPWDLYDRYNQPKPWTPAIVQVLEGLVKEFPNHPGSSHYYIHAIEGSAHPEAGLAVANRLGKMMPGLAHLVHMPSHIYIRSGYYNEGVIVNEAAVKSYEKYLTQYAPVVNNTPIYLIHNLHMQASCANMDGRLAESMKIAIDCRKSFDSTWMDIPGYFGGAVQYAYMTPFLTLIRFGKWNEILQTPEISMPRVYANLLWHYGRGLAYARKHVFDKALAELDSLRANRKVPQMDVGVSNFNAANAGAGVAEKILQGTIAQEQQSYKEAIAFFNDAVEQESVMYYNEPRDWPHPARQYLGNCLLLAKQYKEAEVVFKDDLQVNPKNGWSLNGLYDALQKQGKKKEAIKVKADAAIAFKRSDVKITRAVF